MLAERSDHNPSIHTRWPVSFLQRRAKLFTNFRVGEKERTIIVDRFSSSPASPQLIHKLSTVDLRDRKHVNIEQKQAADRIFFVIPYCHAFASAGISSAVRKIESMLVHDMRCIFRRPPTICLSWSNYMPNMDSVLTEVTEGVLRVGRREKKYVSTLKKLGNLESV